jgi:hypothetical protein
MFQVVGFHNLVHCSIGYPSTWPVSHIQCFRIFPVSRVKASHFPIENANDLVTADDDIPWGNIGERQKNFEFG